MQKWNRGWLLNLSALSVYFVVEEDEEEPLTERRDSS